MLVAGCAHRPAVPPPHRITVYYCRVGSDDLVPMPFTVNADLTGPALANYAVAQLLAGPPVGRDRVVLFPAGTAARVSLKGDTAVVDVTGSVARSFQSGAGDEVGMFKSLTFTLTDLPGIRRVQVLVTGRKAAALPGGHFEIDEPLTRDTFAS